MHDGFWEGDHVSLSIPSRCGAIKGFGGGGGDGDAGGSRRVGSNSE